MLLKPHDMNGPIGEPGPFSLEHAYQIRRQVEFERFANEKRRAFLIGEARKKCREILEFVPPMHQSAIQWLEVTQPGGQVLVLARYPGRFSPLRTDRQNVAVWAP